MDNYKVLKGGKVLIDSKKNILKYNINLSLKLLEQDKSI